MKIEDLKNKVDEFKVSLEKTNLNREIWQTRTKPLLIDTLSKITDNYPIGWTVQILDWTSNSEGVNITFNPSRSGFVENNGQSLKSHIKQGGTIVFSQAYNGEIFIIILFPSIDGFVTRADDKLLGRFKPETITEEFIINYVAKFIDEMIKWEKSTFINPVGFKTK